MATYHDIKGQKVQYLSSDPSNLTEGQVWYNSTSNTAKVRGYGTAAFAAGGTYPFPGRQIGQATTSSTNGLGFGGVTSVPGAGRSTESNKYDGTSWTATPATPAGTTGAGFGIPTAAIFTGSNPGPFDGAYSWNDVAWSTINPMASYNRTNQGAFGTQTAGIVAGGEPAQNTTREFDGTCFTAGPLTNLLMGGGCSGAGGTSTGAVLSANNATPASPSGFEEWTGTAWTSSTNSPTTNAYGYAAGEDQDNFLAMGSLPGGSMLWDGSSWATTAALSTSRGSGAPNSGTSVSSALVVGGSTPGVNYDTTEEWTGAGAATQTITTS